MMGQQAFGEATHALMRKHYPYCPWHPGAHLCPAESMVETPAMETFTMVETSAIYILD